MKAALARGEQGLVDPYRVHKARPLAEHVAEYLANLRAAGRDGMYVYNAERRLNILTKCCDWVTLGDAEPNGFIRWREVQRTAESHKRGRMGAVSSATALNQYLDTVRAFTNWCAQTHRLPGVPVKGRMASTVPAGVAKVEGPKVRKRRALSDEQVAKLQAVAPAGRVVVYRTAWATGLRRSELAALVWSDLHLAAARPYAELRAEATKAHRGDRACRLRSTPNRIAPSPRPSNHN